MACITVLQCMYLLSESLYSTYALPAGRVCLIVLVASNCFTLGGFVVVFPSCIPLLCLLCSVSSKATTHSMQFFMGKFIFLTHDHNTEWKESSCILDMPEDGSLCWLFSVWHFCVGNYRVCALVEWNVSTVLRAGLCHYLSTLWNCVLYHKQLFLSAHTHARTHHCMYIRTCSCTDVSSFSSNDLI